jgi:hypothetical protein
MVRVRVRVGLWLGVRVVQKRTQGDKKLPAIQAEQVELDVAPVTAEYVPAKARDEEYWGVSLDSKTSA